MFCGSGDAIGTLTDCEYCGVREAVTAMLQLVDVIHAAKLSPANR